MPPGAPRGSPVTRRLLAAALAAALLSPGCDRRVPPASPKASSAKHDADYLAALAACDEFCHAWLHGDLVVGKALLSARIRRAFPDRRIQDAIVGAPNPRHAAFEISDGERTGAGFFTFRVRLFYRYSGQAEDRIEGPVEQIVVQRDGSGTWLVDRFPLLEEPG